LARIIDSADQRRDNAAASTVRVWPVYRRLMGYALRYRFKVAVVVLFSLIVAISISSMIFSVGTLVDILYMDEADVPARVATYTEKLSDWAATMDSIVGWAPEGLGERAENAIWSMREDRSRALYLLAGLVIGLTVIGAAARFVQEYFAGVISASVTTQLNRDMFDTIMTLSHDFFEGRTTGEIVARFTNDSFMVNNGLLNVFVKLVREPMKAATLLFIAMTVDLYLTAIVLFVLSPLILLLLAVGRKLRKRVQRSLTSVAAMASVVTETVAGITVIKGFRMEKYEGQRMADELRTLRKQLIKISKADAIVAPSTEVLLVLGVGVLLVLSEQRIASGSLTTGSLLILFGALAAVVDPVRKLSRVSNAVQISAASAERVFNVIDLKPNVAEKAGAADLAPLSRAIRFEDVSFTYDGDTPVLSHVDLEVKKGEMVALVGFSGAGKSTMVKLLPRFYDPTAGRIMVDGVDIRDVTLSSLRDQISIVTQENILFNESVRKNITFGRDDFQDARVEQAARAAHAEEFIVTMPGGYDAPIHEAGKNLSGGQRQRIAIARAIIKDPAILILDEATSSLDSESEKIIQQAIDEFVEGRTTLVIAHRLSTVLRADRIVVMEQGRVAEQGTHQELLAKDGLYGRLYKLQFSGEEADAPSTDDAS
jgi:ATP-binding cassette, subfamily B, bacterial MsbA